MSKITPYLERIIDNPKILNLHINLLNKCNCKCVFCRKYEWPQCELKFDILKQTIEYFELQGGETIVFSGGDPLLYSDLEKLIEYLNTTTIKYSFITTTLASVDRLKLVAENAHRIHVSYDAINSEIYKQIRGVDGSETVYTNIRFMQIFRKRLNKIPIRMSMVISKINYREVNAVYEVAKELGCAIHYTLVNLYEDIQLTKDELKRLYYTIADMDSKIATNTSLLEEIKRFINGEGKIVPEECIVQKIHMLIDPDGSVYPCCVLLEENSNYNHDNKTIYGNINKDNVVKIFKKAQLLNYKPSCKECEGCINRYIHINKEYSEYKKINNKLFI